MIGFLHVQAGSPRVTRLSTSGSRQVDIDAQHGLVSLDGWVSTRSERELLDSLVRRVPGVLQVINDVIVSPKPPRHSAARFANFTVISQRLPAPLARAV